MENPETSGSSRQCSVSPTSWCHPAHKAHRFFALVLMCFLCFGSYFCYDTPGALVDNFTDDMHLNTSQFALLYSIYSWPNVVLCFIGGYLIDRYFGVRLGAVIYMTIVFIGAVVFAHGAYVNAYVNFQDFDYPARQVIVNEECRTTYFGVRLGTVIYMTIVFIGAVVFALGAYVNAFWVMILGRFIFGIGGESLQVAVNNYVVLWFKGKELNMVFGLQLSFSRFGSTVNFWVMEPIYRWVGNYYTGYERLGVALFIASMTCFISLVCGLILGWMDYRAEKILERQEENDNQEPFQIKDIKDFKPVFWLVCVICVAYYLAIFPFIALGKLFFERKFDFLPREANNVNSMVYFLSAALSPFFGILIDKTGRNMMWIIVSIITTLGAHFMLAFTFFNPYIGVITLGISYSLLASCLWPLVPFIVPENQLGTAYGICQAVQNLGLGAVMIMAGAIVDQYGYLMLEMFFLSCLFVSLIAAVLIYIMDSASDGVLNMSPSMRENMKPQVISKSSDDTPHLLDNEESGDYGDTDYRRPSDADSEATIPRDHALEQSERIRTRYLAQILPNTNIPERQ